MAEDTSVRVALRIRPQIPREIIDMCRTCTSVTPGEPQVWLGNDKAFTFDYVFDMNSLQMEIYETCVHSLIEGCFDGFNATVLAYGQTGSGKTYTMGTGLDVTIPPEEFGIIPRAVDHLFRGIEDRQQQATANRQQPPEFKVICQFMELYNEEVIDLFDTTRDSFSRSRKSNIKIQEDVSGCISAIGLTSKIVTSKHETMQCLKLGALSRTTASTQMNVQSSRSHAVFTLHIKQQRIITCKDSESGEVTEVETLTAKFHFVDLAGSERLKRTGATGERAKEGISINCGLLALGNVISALGDKTKKGSHVPYRDSKLTRLLQDSLGGNSRTLMIACISPSDRDFMETLNTLKYANRARNIKNKITVNQDKSSKTIASLRMEIQQLQLELMEYKQGKRLVVDGVESINDMYQEITMQQTEINNLRTRVKAMQETIDQLNARNAQLLTEKALGNWIAPENASADMTQLVQGYMKEIEELRTKLCESENNCQVLRRNATRAQSRISVLSPRLPMCDFDQGVDADEMLSVDDLLDEAKMDIVRMKRKEKRLKHKTSESEKDGDDQEKLDIRSDDDENAEESDDVDLSSESDSDEKENVKYEEDIAELTCEISIKQKLIEELERSQRRLHTMRQQYEDKLLQLQNKIRTTQEEMDKVLSTYGSAGSQSQEKARKVKEEYERKLSSLQSEMKKLQDAKKKHAQMLKNQSQYEQQLKVMRSELTEMKKTKVRLLNKMKEESAKRKEMEARSNREIAQLKKESRRHENQIRTLEADKRMKEVILRRKQEEVMVLRKLAKPMSDKVAGRAIRPRTALSTFEKKKTFSPKLAKLKWQTVEKEVNKLILNRQATSNLEKDMERYLEDRDKLRLKMKKVAKKRDRAILECKGEAVLKDFEDQIENIKANMDYIQGNITECQTNIMQMEEPAKEGGSDALETGAILSGLGYEDVKYLLEKVLLFALNQGQLAARREVSLKELEAKIQQVNQNSSVQQQLLHHILTQQEMDVYNSYLGEDLDENVSTESSRSSSPVNSSSNSTIQGDVSSQVSVNLDIPAPRASYREKVRRRTATPQELLFADSGSQGDGFISKLSITDLEEDRSHEVIKSARENGKDFSNANGIHRVPSAPGSLKMMASSNISPSPVLGRKLHHSMQLPETSPRPHRKSSSQPVNLPVYSRTHSLDSNHDVTPPASPTATRKSRDDNVFSRLTSHTSLSVETNLDRGIIQPYTGKAKSAPLSCTHVAEGHSKAVLSVDATNDFLFSASKDRSVKIWDLHTGTEIQSLENHPGNVTVVKYSEKTHLIFSVSQSYVKVWDIRENPVKCCKTLSSLGLISHIPSSTGASSRSSSNSKETIHDIALNNSGSTLFTASGNIVRIWDLRKFLCFGKLNGGHQAAVMCLAVNDIQRDQCLVITGSKDHYIKVFEVTEGIGSIYTPSLNLDPPHYDGIESLAVKGQYLFSASRDMCIKKWDLAEKEMKQSLNQAHKDWICGLKVLPSGQTLVSGCRGGYMKVWSVENCAQLGEIKAHATSINAIATNLHSVFTASNDGTVGIWKMKEGFDHAGHFDSS